jgi:hypothetical protein
MAVNFDVLDSKHRAAKQAKSSFKAMQQKNRAMLCGQQWAVYDETQQSLVQETAQDRRADEKGNLPLPKERVTDNVLRQAEEQRLAECVFRKPDTMFGPRSLSQKSKVAAALADKTWDVKWDELDMRRKMYMIRGMADTDAESYLWVYWDKQKGRIIRNEQGKPQFEGDADIIVVSDQQVFVEPNKDYLEDCNWVFVEFGMSIDEVLEQFPKAIKEDDLKRMKISGTKPHSEIGAMWSNLLGNAPSLSLTEAPHREDAAGKEKSGGYVTVVHYLEKPTHKHPEGQHIVYTSYISRSNRQARYKVLSEGPLELKGRPEGFGNRPQFPLFEFWSGGATKVGRYYGDPEMNSARAQQHYLNELKTKIKETIETAGSPLIGMDIEGFPPGADKGQTGSLIVKQGGVNIVKYSGQLSTGGRFPVTALGGLNPPASMFKEAAEAERRIYEILGVSKIGMQAVRQDAYQLQQSATRLQVNIVEPQEAQLAKVVMYYLRLCQNYYSLPRKIHYTGGSFMVPQVEFVRGEDIDFTTCQIERGSMMQATQWARRQDAMLAWKMQLIDPTPQNKRRLLRLFGSNDIFPSSTESLNEQRAQNENLKFLMMTKGTKEYGDIEYDFDRTGAKKAIQAFGNYQQEMAQGGQASFDPNTLSADGYILPDNDDHEIHAWVHNSFILSPEVQNLPNEQYEQMVDIVNVHKELHEIAHQLGLGFSEATQQMKQALQAQAMQSQAEASSQGGGATDLEAQLGGGEKPHRRSPASHTPAEFAPEEHNPLLEFRPEDET